MTKGEDNFLDSDFWHNSYIAFGACKNCGHKCNLLMRKCLLVQREFKRQVCNNCGCKHTIKQDMDMNNLYGKGKK